ncbi:MAG: glycoside hydrolase family 9 protein [Lewinellaceae bacterium]|nr:glycoside hydrolase family 9 protein [Lewinellaceae bacterium]
MAKSIIFHLLFASLALTSCSTQAPKGTIHLNQLGFYPKGPKIAIISAEGDGAFSIFSADLKKEVFRGQLKGPQTSSFSGKKTWIADFSEFREEGAYKLAVSGLDTSCAFEIKPAVHRQVAEAALKAFYFQRMSTELPEQYAGQWSRPFSHPDTSVLIHPSAATEKRPAGTIIASPGGWYDAGDYNKYIVNSGITVSTLLSLYEDFPDYFDHLTISIPESGSALPGLLDEALWNLRWMLTMQDPDDGGVYHKCTTAGFEGFVPPQQATSPRYVVQKSTQASLDFAATLAQAARVFRKFEAELPGFADQCMNAAVKAWQWAKANPAALYDQQKINEQFDPDITTGAYGGRELEDEFIWAAVELYITTGDEHYFKAVELFPEEEITLQSWGDVRTMAYYTLLRHAGSLTPAAQPALFPLKKRFISFADGLARNTEKTAYLAPMENEARNYVWGSNGVCANQGMAFLYACRLTNEEKFLDLALANLDYLLGRNPTGYSFVTGYGSRTPMHPHHRLSETDGVENPVPGLLVGGPNPHQQDKCPGYPSQVPDESYLDDVCSYASNEIAINWNAAFVYLAFGVEIVRNNE